MTVATPLLTQRWRERRDLYRPAGEVIRPAEYDVAPIEEKPAKAFVLQHHYSASWPAARFRFGLYRRGRLVGTAVYSHPVNNKVLTNVFPGAATDSVELGRFILLDEVPSNGETWFLARTTELLRREPLVGVVSFSDPVPRRASDGRLVFPGHIGIIYQAASARFLGRASRRTLRVFPDGSVLSARARQKVRSAHDKELGQGWAYVVAQLVRFGAPAPGCYSSGRQPEPGELHSWLDSAIARCTTGLAHSGTYRYAWPLHRAGRRMLEGKARPYPKQLAIPRSGITLVSSR